MVNEINNKYKLVILSVFYFIVIQIAKKLYNEYTSRNEYSEYDHDMPIY